MSTKPRMANNYIDKQPIFLFFTRVRENQKSFLLAFSFLLVILLIALINITSLISFILFLLASITLYRILFDKDIKKITGIFVFYSLMAIALFLLQYATLPEYKGFSGGLGIGTDDARYFEGAVGSSPLDFSLPGNIAHTTFSKVLRIVAKILPLKNIHLLDLLFFNVFGLAFVPVFTSRVCYLLTKQKKIAEVTYKFSMICPLMMTNGLVLVRDGWTAVLFIAPIYFLLSNRYILLAVTSVLLFYIRIASGMQLFIALLLFSYYMFSTYRSNYLKKAILCMTSMVGMASIIIIFYPIILDYMLAKNMLSNLLFRENFLDFMNQSVAMSGRSSIFYTINTQPFYLRIPLGFTFFLCGPFLSIMNWSNLGVYIPRVILGQFFAILFLFYLKYLVQAVVYLWKNKESGMILLAAIFLFLILLLSQLSLQFRHKTMLMPLFYILVAYGYYNKTKIGESFGILGGCSLFFLQLGVNCYYLF